MHLIVVQVNELGNLPFPFIDINNIILLHQGLL